MEIQLRHYSDKLAFEIDAWDLQVALDTGENVVVIDALRKTPHPTHFTLDEAMAAGRRIAARRTLFTHMCHDLPHAATNRTLPAGVELAYDGLTLDVRVA